MTSYLPKASSASRTPSPVKHALLTRSLQHHLAQTPKTLFFMIETSSAAERRNFSDIPEGAKAIMKNITWRFAALKTGAENVAIVPCSALRRHLILLPVPLHTSSPGPIPTIPSVADVRAEHQVLKATLGCSCRPHSPTESAVSPARISVVSTVLPTVSSPIRELFKLSTTMRRLRV